MTTTARYATSFPVLTHDVVTQGHADYCAEHGHATHTVADVVQPRCIRCGESIKRTAQVGDTVRFVDGRVAYIVESITYGIAECRHGGLYRSGPVDDLVVLAEAQPTVDDEQLSDGEAVIYEVAEVASFDDDGELIPARTVRVPAYTAAAARAMGRDVYGLSDQYGLTIKRLELVDIEPSIRRAEAALAGRVTLEQLQPFDLAVLVAAAQH